MIVAFTLAAWEDYQYWQKENETTVQKINALVKEIIWNPFTGSGKPEPLRGNLAGYWSRRITGEHRLVYKLEGTKPKQTLTIIQVRFHY
jgi:toxin YoeB